MRTRLYSMALLGAGLLALPALAQPPDGPRDGDRPPSDQAMKQKLLDSFDTNKDGTIDRAEARAIGRALREFFDVGPGPGRPDGPEGRRPEGPPPRDREARGPDGPPPPGPPRDRDARGPEGRRGPRGERGPDGRGPEGRGPEDRGPERRGPDDRGPGGPPPGGPPPRDGVDEGPPGPPNPERLFNRFDENKDGSLSKDEFKKLTDFMRENRPLAMRDRGRGDRGPEGPPPRGDFRRGPDDGPDGRRPWRRQGPPGPPPGPEDPPGPPGASSSDSSSVEGTAADETAPAEEPVDAV